MHFSCVSKAECQNDNETGIHECRCSKGYIESDKRTCAIAYGQNCEPFIERHSCDAVANLICKNGKCACPGFQVYDNSTSKCQGLVGAKCDLKNAHVKTFCVDGAYCQSYRDGKLGQGVCRCGNSWIADSNRKCVLRVPQLESTDLQNNTFLNASNSSASKI